MVCWEGDVKGLTIKQGPGRGPTAQGKQGNRENGQKKSLSGKTQGIWKVCQNTGKTQGIWFAQVVNSLILKVKDILIFAMKISNIT